MLYFFIDNINNGFNNITLELVTIIAILCGILVITSKNPIVSILFLIGLFLSISIYLMIIGLNFIGLSYLLVYVGAVSILFLFILMLINVRISEIVSTTSNNIPLSIFISVLFFSTVYKALPTSNSLTYQIKASGFKAEEGYSINIIDNSIKKEIFEYFYSIYSYLKYYISKFTNDFISVTKDHISTDSIHLKATSFNSLSLTYPQNWDNMLIEISHINTLGNILYSSFPLWILLTSLILLLAMVGAILITLKN